ncbi:hypothetical protein L2E82_36084 [Cichorium intybus]|uniref:Uncharacterized protein n=1 Tax=Cichorium intybus TaxID=13427 RepID=A0ACB9BQN7_CICIN|nr:hypothetical protein L2E82_36084 [Cichorium intybus]
MLAPRSSGQYQPPTSTGYHSTFDFTKTDNTHDANAPTTGPNLENSLSGNPTAGSEPLFASLGLGDDGVVVPSPQPTEKSVAQKGGSCPPKVKRGCGRPKRIEVKPVTVPLSGNVMAPRRQPKRAGRLNGGVGESRLGSRRSSRPYVSKFGSLTRRPVLKPSKVGPWDRGDNNESTTACDPNYGTVTLQVLQELKGLVGVETSNGPLHGQTQEPEPVLVLVSVLVSAPYSHITATCFLGS